MNMMPDKIQKVVLVGPRAAGKTTLGRALADRLGWGFRDTDDLLAAAAGQPAEDYLQKAGEAAFRTIEEQVVGAALLSTDPEVLALGGGAVLSASVRKALRRNTRTRIRTRTRTRIRTRTRTRTRTSWWCSFTPRCRSWSNARRRYRARRSRASRCLRR